MGLRLLLLPFFQEPTGGGGFPALDVLELGGTAVLALVLIYFWRFMNRRIDQLEKREREQRAEYKADFERMREQHLAEMGQMRGQHAKDLADLHAKLLSSETARASLEGQNSQMAKRIEDQAAHILRLETRMERVEQNGGSAPAPRKRRAAATS